MLLYLRDICILYPSKWQMRRFLLLQVRAVSSDSALWDRACKEESDTLFCVLFNYVLDMSDLSELSFFSLSFLSLFLLSFPPISFPLPSFSLFPASPPLALFSLQSSSPRLVSSPHLTSPSPCFALIITNSSPEA